MGGFEHPPAALVLGCNTPETVGVLSDWLEEQTGYPLDVLLGQSGFSDGAAGYFGCGYGDGDGYGSINRDGDGLGNGNAYDYGYTILGLENVSDGVGHGNNGNSHGDGNGSSWNDYGDGNGVGILSVWL